METNGWIPPLSGNGHRKPLRIAIVGFHTCPFRPTGELNSGGLNVYLKEMTRNLAPLVEHIDIFTASHPMSLPRVHNILPNLRIVHLPDRALAAQDKNELYEHLPQFTDALLDFTRGARYDVVYSHYWLSTLPGAALAGDHTPHIITFHTLQKIKQRHMPSAPAHPLRAAVETRMARAAKSVIAWSEQEKADIAQICAISADKIAVIPPGVDAALFNAQARDSARAKLNMNGALNISYVGRLDAIKGIPSLAEAVADIKSEHPYRLNIIGDGEHPDDLPRLRERLERVLPPRAFKLWGSIKHANLPLYYAATDIYASASYYESFGLAALEASASGAPLVAPAVGGLSSIVIDGYNGYLVPQTPAPQPAQFTRRFEKLLDDARLRRELGDNGARRAAQFNWGKITRALRDHFYAIL